MKITFALLLLTVAWGSSPFPSPGGKILYDVPLIRQSTSYSCGAGALLSVLEYYGIEDYNESELMAELGTTAEAGTIIERMAEFAVRHEIQAVVKSNLTTDDLAHQVKKGQASIVEAQAWGGDDAPAPGESAYPDGWDSGHYLVVIGVDRKNVYFMDPSLVGGRGFIPIDEFNRRWHDISAKGEKLHHTAILFTGKPKPPPPWAQIP